MMTYIKAGRIDGMCLCSVAEECNKVNTKCAVVIITDHLNASVNGASCV